MKERIDIVIMANVDYIVWIRCLPLYFNQVLTGKSGCQMLVTLSTNFIGYGLAGLTRRFLVYPSRGIWLSNLITIAFNVIIVMEPPHSI
ncbi:hypothetical protein BDM02DRAFT_3268205 [Thelephora ganbajun]|uniref:Uncharacterized protein n=1 Tax=Thelephora ganbajun TaxID=370292 RepID=A0ACB6ZKL0_THEGA|nr:hypothetical protein BDM02DRAFT_3268205 [Thelephora ganbajun]